MSPRQTRSGAARRGTTVETLPKGVTRVPGSPFLYIRVPRANGSTWRTSAKTTNAVVAWDILNVLWKLAREKPERRALLDDLYEGTLALFPRPDHPGEEGLYDVLNEEGMAGADRLVAQRALQARDVDLVPLAEQFGASTEGLHPRKLGRRVRARTRRNDARSVHAFLRYCAQERRRQQLGLDVLPPAQRIAPDLPFECRSPWVTPGHAEAYLQGLAAWPGARRKHHLAIRLFYRYCQVRHAMPWLQDPTATLTVEPVGRHRISYLEQVDCEQLATALDAISSMHGDFSRVMHATGLDVTDMAQLTVGDIDLVGHRIRSIGGKTPYRERQCLVLDWAWPTVQRLVAGKRGTDRLFPGMPANRHAHDKAHARARATLVAAGHSQFAGYQPRDARHSVAVQMILAGVPLVHIGRQLGHRDGALVLKVYGQFTPAVGEERRWQTLLAERAARVQALRETPTERTDAAEVSTLRQTPHGEFGNGCMPTG